MWTRAARAFGIDALVLSDDGHARYLSRDHCACLVSRRPLGEPGATIRFFRRRPVEPHRALPPDHVPEPPPPHPISPMFFAELLALRTPPARSFVFTATPEGCAVVADGERVAIVDGLRTAEPFTIPRKRLAQLARVCDPDTPTTLAFDGHGVLALGDDLLLYWKDLQ